METHGLFNSLYVDRGSHDRHTEAAGGTVDQTRLSLGAPRLAATGDHVDPRLFAGSPWSVGAGLVHVTGSVSQRARACRHDREGRSQSVSP